LPMQLLLTSHSRYCLHAPILPGTAHVALTGNCGERRIVPLGPWRWAMLGYCLVVTSLSFFLPMLVVLQAAFAKAWGRGLALDNLTLRNVRFVLVDQPATRTATLNTFVYAGAASLIALGLALAIAYIVARRLVGPLLKRGLAGAFILVFIPATRELSSAIFLYTTGTQVLSVLLFDKSDEGNFEILASMGLILVVATVALVLLGFRLVGRDFMLRRTAS